MKAFITKWALTEGILEIDGDVSIEFPTVFIPDKGECFVTDFHGSEWHRTQLTAKCRAEEMRKSKIASLKKSLAKLEALKFT